MCIEDHKKTQRKKQQTNKQIKIDNCLPKDEKYWGLHEEW